MGLIVALLAINSALLIVLLVFLILQFTSMNALEEQMTEEQEISDEQQEAAMEEDQGSMDEVMTDDEDTSSDSYTWAKWGMNFDMPEGYNGLESGNTLFITKADQLPDGDVTYNWTSITVIQPAQTADDRIIELGSQQSIEWHGMTDIRNIGANQYSTISFTETFGNQVVEYYWLESPSALIELRSPEDSNLLDGILPTLDL